MKSGIDPLASPSSSFSSSPESLALLPSAYARLLVDFLQSRQGREEPQLARLAVQLPRVRWLELLAEVAAQLREPELPVRIGAALQVRHLGIAGQVLLSCDTLGEAAEQFCRYCRLVDDMGYTRIRRGEHTGEASFHWGAGGAEVPPPAMEQIWAGAMLGLSRWLTGRSDLVCDFDFHQPPPAAADLAPFERLLGGRLRFGRPATRAIFPAWVMDLPVATHFPEMRPIVEAQAEASLRALERKDDASHDPAQALVRRTRELIAEYLARGTATAELIAPQLALSTRTLNRRLAEAGTSFRALGETVRRQRAEHLLANPAVSLAEISFMLGYQEQSTFQRAFKRWTGLTPGEFRADCLRLRRETASA
ncbi:putative transcriptional regulator [Sterolibacterium denitrificans]|uniref:Putative transcriptional regulator n=1 Tax=Sterolibacterium denitrificans TaxID=157592 RepID=A9XWD6_9PROT|nr:AraC family transcriptional regulator [Sterolibacterium denitrificans]ABV59996.1 putative transcriptional regulator [Sterolibacterium denitrificans]SMB21955.1 putative transcriptional regulator [Sterolibacterium denitrificans]